MKTALRIKSLYLVKSAALLALLFVFGLSELPIHAATDTARVVKYAQNDIVPIKAKLRYLNAHHPARKRRDSRLHDRRQGILDHQRRAQPLLHPSGTGRNSQQPESHHGERSRLFVPALRDQQRPERRPGLENRH